MNTIVITNGAKQSLPTSTVIASEAKQSRANKGKIAAPISWARNDDHLLDSRLRGNDNRASDGMRLLRQGNALPRNDDRIIEGNVIASEAKQSRADKGKIAAPISWACNGVPIHTKHLNLRTQA